MIMLMPLQVAQIKYAEPRNPLSIDASCEFVTERGGCVSPALSKISRKRQYSPCDNSHCNDCPKYLNGIAIESQSAGTKTPL